MCAVKRIMQGWSKGLYTVRAGITWKCFKQYRDPSVSRGTNWGIQFSRICASNAVPYAKEEMWGGVRCVNCVCDVCLCVQMCGGGMWCVNCVCVCVGAVYCVNCVCDVCLCDRMCVEYKPTCTCSSSSTRSKRWIFVGSVGFMYLLNLTAMALIVHSWEAMLTSFSNVYSILHVSEQTIIWAFMWDGGMSLHIFIVL